MVGDWSSGMIPASGAGGRGFDSRITPPCFFLGFVNGVFSGEVLVVIKCVWLYVHHVGKAVMQALLAQLGRAFDF